MKAIIKKEKSPGLWMGEVPVPEIQDYEVLIKVRKVSICGTDLSIYKWTDWAKKAVSVPLVVGHEFSGEIVEVGSQVSGLYAGDRVSGEGHLICGQCINCRKGKKHLCPNTVGIGVQCDGCFAEYLAIPAENVFPLVDSISDDMGAIFDPYGNAVHTALSYMLTSEDVLITGAGPIGIMAAAIARNAGARHVVITDINDYRLDLAKRMGATCTVNVKDKSLHEAQQELGLEEGFGVGLEMSGNPDAFSSMLEAMSHGGKVALLGILPSGAGIDWDLVIFKMLEIKGIYGREIFNTWYQMSHLLEAGLDISPIITHQFPFEEFEKGFETAFSGNSGKVILNLP